MELLTSYLRKQKEKKITGTMIRTHQADAANILFGESGYCEMSGILLEILQDRCMSSQGCFILSKISALKSGPEKFKNSLYD